MIVDSSALVAVVRGEDDADIYVDALSASTSRRASTATMLECAVVLDRDESRLLAELASVVGLQVVPFDVPQLEVAREAHRRFGRRSGSPARLDLGDCFTYALAKVAGEPLLFKGDDFTHTDLIAAV